MIEPFGELTYSLRENEWFGYAKNISSQNEVELTLKVDNVEQNLVEKIEIVRHFADDINSLMNTLYEFVHKTFLQISAKLSKK